MEANKHRGGGLNLRRKKSAGPLISVLMPVRNGIKYIGEAIDSIIDQTMDDWELVIIDDASTDGTGAYVQRRAAQDARIVFHRRDGDDLGEAGKLNAGLTLCRGEWLARMDADDRATPYRLERQLAFMLQNRDVALVSCLARCINADGELVPLPAPDLPPREAYVYDPQRDDIMSVLLRGAFTRRETLVRTAGDGAQFTTGEGRDPWNRVAEMGPTLVQPEYLMQYRIDLDSPDARIFDMRPEDSVLARSTLTSETFPWQQQARPLDGRPAHSRHLVSAARRFASSIALRTWLHRGNDAPLDRAMNARLRKAAASREVRKAWS